MVFDPLQRVAIPSDGFHWVVLVRIDGVDFPLVVDTGASRTTFDLETVATNFADLNIVESEDKSASVGAVNLDSALCVFPKLSFQGKDFYNATIALLDLAHVKHAYSMLGLPPVLGVLGADLLVQGNASIDCARNFIRWRKRI